MMQLIPIFSLLPENRLLSNLSSKWCHNFSQKLSGNICLNPVSIPAHVLSVAHTTMGGGFSALLFRPSLSVAHRALHFPSTV